jgi:hypothetical protein
VWGVVSLAGLPPLRGPGDRRRAEQPADRGRAWCGAALRLRRVRFFLLYRRRRSVVLLSIITADDPARRGDGRRGARPSTGSSPGGSGTC